MYNVVTIVDNTVYLKVVKRVDLENSHHKKIMVTRRGDGC